MRSLPNPRMDPCADAPVKAPPASAGQGGGGASGRSSSKRGFDTASRNADHVRRRAAMKVEFPEFAHHADTLIAVAVGAVLATIGGFVATVLEARLHRRDREK